MPNDPTGLTSGLSVTNPFGDSPAPKRRQIRAIGIYVQDKRSITFNQVSYELGGDEPPIYTQEGMIDCADGPTHCTIEVEGVVCTDGSDGMTYLEQAKIAKTLVSVALKMGGQFRRVDMRVLKFGAKSSTETGMTTEAATLFGAVPGFSSDGTKRGSTS